MCGIVGAVANRDVVPILIEGLRRLEYRGYDSTGVAVVGDHGLQLQRAVGKVARLAERLQSHPCAGPVGIAHSRWATHGGVTEANAHPHVSGKRIALIHNGIIENYVEIKASLVAKGYAFTSETDTEVIAHLVHDFVRQKMDLTAAVQHAVGKLQGAYAIVVFDAQQPDRIVVARIASPLVIGLGASGENFVASDVQALLPVTRRFQFLEEGDVADIRRDRISIFDAAGKPVERRVHESSLSADAVDKGPFAHYMQKEIFEQPRAVADTLSERIANDHVLDAVFGPQAPALFGKVRGAHIVACGTSFHAGLIARYYFEQGAGLPCTVEVASEYRYRNPVVRPGTLFITISQSGETADTLAALREAKKLGYLATLAICNVPESSIVREADLVLMTRAGPEIGVASTKAFTTQLAALGLLGLALARHQGVPEQRTTGYTRQLMHVPGMIEHALKLDPAIREWAKRFADKHHALFLGRGASWPVAMEGALKLKEISYIHAEAYPAGELKHGPLALVDEDMPVVAVAPNNALLEKLKSNLQEVRARGGQLYVFADPDSGIEPAEGVEVIRMPEHVEPLQQPLVYTVPLQLLAYHTAVLRGTDVDQPRNLAKSVTVE
jgi:glucosamine--fructose-6-phosphate aminotransferase (isomerizing)